MPASREAGTPSSQTPPVRGEISLPALIGTLRRGFWLILAIAALAVLGAAAVLKARPPVYTATMVVAPAERDLAAVGRVAAELQQYADFATLGQLPSRAEYVPTIDRYVELFSSVLLAQRLEREHGLLREVFDDEWDQEAQAWRAPSGGLSAARQEILGFFGFPAWSRPDAASLSTYLRERIEIEASRASGLRRLSMSATDGAFAARVLTLAHEAADDMLRQGALERTSRQIAQLEAELEQAQGPNQRNAIQQTLEEQYKVQAMLVAELPFAAEVVSPAVASSVPASISPLLVLPLAAVVGLILGTFIVLLRDALRGAS